MGAQLIFLVLILTPFVLFGSELEAWLEALVAGEHNVAIGIAAISLLSLDVFLPVPSSFVNMSATLYLGPTLGFLIVFSGLMLSCLIGYWFGYHFRKLMFDRFYQDRDFRKLTFDLTRFGFLTLVIARGMPVFAELSVMAAGYHQYPMRKFIFATLISNGLLAAIYALFVTISANVHSTAFLVFTLVAVPGIALMIRWVWNRWTGEPEPLEVIR